VKRREFITLIGGGAAGLLARSFAARAQSALPVIGILHSASADTGQAVVDSFKSGLSETGFFEGQNVVLEYRWADGLYDRLPSLAADLIRRRVSVIAAAGGNASALAAQAATPTIPIVFVTGVDPVQAGLVKSLNRPGGNLTGVTSLGVELGPKRLELLLQVFPGAKDIALLVNPANRSTPMQTRIIQAAADALGPRLHILQASTEREIDSAFATLKQTQATALVIAPESFFNSQTARLAELTVRHAMPAIYTYREFAAAGGLMSYGGNIANSYRAAGVYVGRILKGEKPSDLAVQQSAKVELIVNLRTAKTLSVDVPATLLARADEVIE
jgi:putative tryptophan/tyrosine transport system substrate-binding protein